MRIYHHAKDWDFFRMDIEYDGRGGREVKAYIEEEPEGISGPYNLPSEFRDFSEERLEDLTEEEFERLKFFVVEQIYVENRVVIVNEDGMIVRNYNERIKECLGKDVLYDAEGNVFREVPKEDRLNV